MQRNAVAVVAVHGLLQGERPHVVLSLTPDDGGKNGIFVAFLRLNTVKNTLRRAVFHAFRHRRRPCLMGGKACFVDLGVRFCFAKMMRVRAVLVSF